MPILYAAVAEDGHLTTEATTEGTRKDFSKVISVLLDRLEHRNYKKSYSHDGCASRSCCCLLLLLLLLLLLFLLALP